MLWILQKEMIAVRERFQSCWNMRFHTAFGVLVLVFIACGADLEPGRLPERWPGASGNCIQEPDWTVHEYNDDLYILRESGCLNYEKPFLYLIFGKERALLLDTGAGRNPGTGATLRLLLTRRETGRKLNPPREVVAVHSHGHGDHVAG